MPWPKLWQSYNSDLRLPIGDKASTLRSGSKETVSDGDLSPQTPGFLRSSTRSLNLDEVLRSEFRGAYAEQDVNKQHSDLSDVFSPDQNDCARFVDSWGFMATFLVLTVYALFTADLDTIFGTPTSKHVLSIVTTVIFGLFLIELVLQCLFKAGYAFRAFFWLDMVALISLLPETWFVQQLFDTDTLVAGRSTRLMKAIRLVVRSSKATRLNRFTRMVRVSAMLPRMFNAAKGKPDEGSKDVENLLERKLHRLFMYLDKDNDGMVSAEMVDVIVRRIIKKRRRRRSLTRLFTSKLGGPQNSPGQNSEENSDEAEPPCDTVAHFRPRSRSVTIRSERTNQEDGTQSAPFGGISTSLSQQKSSQALQELTRRRSRSVTIRTEDCHDGTNSSAAAHPDMDGSTSSAVMLPQRLQRMQTYHTVTSGQSSQALQVHPSFHTDGAQSDQLGTLSMTRAVSDPGDEAEAARKRRAWSKKSSLSSASLRRSASAASMESDDEETLQFSAFRERVLEDELVKSKLVYACQSQLGKGASMKNIGRSHVEDVGVKVALLVILLLFVLSFVAPTTKDRSMPMVLEQLDLEASYRFSDWNASTLPQDLLEASVLWKEGMRQSMPEPTLLYLDLNARVLCSEMGGVDALKCSQLAVDSLAPWPSRTTLDQIDAAIKASPYRTDDIEMIRQPVLDHVDTSLDLDAAVRSIALVSVRELNEQEAVNSLVISWTVIFIILVGMFTITRDLATLSRKLLEPLRSLADEMQSIAQLQLAGVSTEKGTRGAAEVRLIQHIFTKTKVAIKSWGKYVPWPVVQNLLVAGAHVRPTLEEREVSLFFSDMASFTSIVESLKPEDTLVLLSRYFNDMSDVIDRFGGVVIEFIGDAIYAVFGAPIRNNNHAEACVKAMLKMQRGVQKINHWSQQLGLPHVSIRCGVHTGWVRVGNIGFHSRLKFGCMGDNANVPSRLEELNKSYGTGNLISEATWNRLPREEFVLRPVDFVDLSYGEELEEMVFEVIQHLGSSRPSPRFILRDTLSRKYERALKLYVDRKFDKAAGAFREVSLQMGQHLGIFDKASVVMRKRASYYQFHPPPNTWRGIWNLSREPDEKDGINEEAVFVCI